MADQGHGIGVTFASGFFASLLGVQWDGITREVIDTTTFATTGARTKAPSELMDVGQLRCDLLFAPGTSPPIIANTQETCTVTWTDAGAATWAATAFMSEFSIDATNEQDRVKASATLEFTGALTITP